MIDECFHLPMQDIMAIEVRMAEKASFEELVRSFHYQQDKELNSNLCKLADKVVDFLKLQGKAQESLRLFLIQKNIPIEVNFKPLKTQQLAQILQQWLSFHSQNSTILEKLYSNNHRNILFKRVLFDQKQTIDDYFQTLSNKNMLKADDLYQLLIEILTPYHLYECNRDGQTFFEKVNSFNTLKEIVQKFINSQKRIVIGSTKEDFQFVRRFQFERLIQFWQSQNSQLILLSERRKNMQEIGIQTKFINIKQQQIQTIKPTITLLELINKTLVELNKLTAQSNVKLQLQSIERIYSCLRKQKLNILDEEDDHLERMTQRTLRHTPISRELCQQNQSINKIRKQLFSTIVSELDGNETIIDNQINYSDYTKTPNVQNLITTRTFSPDNKIKDTLQDIYYFYSEIGQLSYYQLQKCLTQLGVIEKKDDYLMSELIRLRIVSKYGKITIEQFKNVFKKVMNEDKQLTAAVLEEFLKAKHISDKKVYNGTAHLGSSFRQSSQRARSYLGKYLGSSSRF